MTQHTRNFFSFKVLTINTHKGFTAFNKRFILPGYATPSRLVGADISSVCRSDERMKCIRCISKTGRTLPTMNFGRHHVERFRLWPQCGPSGITVTRFFLAIHLGMPEMRDVSIRRGEKRGVAYYLPHYAAITQPPYPTSCAYISACGEPPPGAVNHAGGMGECLAGIRTGAGGRRL